MPTKTKAAATPVEEAPEMEEQIETAADAESFGDGEPETDAGACAMPETELPTRLTGDALLLFFNEQREAGVEYDKIARSAGYYTVTKDGNERIARAQFNAALLEAQGIETGSKPASSGGRGRGSINRARVSSQGILLVSQLAVAHVGAERGAIFEVSYPGDGSILLSPTGEIKPVVPREKRKEAAEEEPGTPLLDQAA